jgi:hypothetical protein
MQRRIRHLPAEIADFGNQLSYIQRIINQPAIPAELDMLGVLEHFAVQTSSSVHILWNDSKQDHVNQFEHVRQTGENLRSLRVALRPAGLVITHPGGSKLLLNVFLPGRGFLRVAA